MLPALTDLYYVASALADRSKAERPDDVRLLASVRDLTIQMRLVLRLGREEHASVVAAESWLDKTRADLGVNPPDGSARQADKPMKPPPTVADVERELRERIVMQHANFRANGEQQSDC
jgi:hypothetical protein